MEHELDKMADRCWRTSATRFESARRMKRCHNASTLCIAMLSFEIIVINLLVFIAPLHLDANAVTIATVCLSVFVLVLSLIVSQLKYEQREHNYHQCAVELGSLEKKIRIFKASGKPVTYDVLMNFRGAYDAIIRNSNLNHSTMDHEWAMRNEEEKTRVYRDQPVARFFHYKWLAFKWYFLRSDSIYHVLTILGAVAVVVIAMCTRI